MSFDFKGTGVAIITPFHDYGTIDFSSFERIINHVINNNVDYVVTLGTTGESPTISNDEKMAVVDFVAETVNKRVPVMFGLGGNNTQEIINTIKSVSFDGVDAVLSVCPYYNKPGQQGIYDHYKAVSGACPVPVVLYNVPGRTSCNISAETTLRLAKDFSNIVAIKEASGNFVQIMEIIRRKPKDFIVISGDDALTFPLMTLGAQGVISVVANAFPAQFSEMVRLLRKGKIKKARNIHYSLIDIMNALFEDGSPGGIKATLEIMGLCTNSLRLPLSPVRPETYNKLKDLVKNYNFEIITTK
jgi:4-hydroxy-tetrahydrodipicolinate synthase